MFISHLARPKKPIGCEMPPVYYLVAAGCGKSIIIAERGKYMADPEEQPQSDDANDADDEQSGSLEWSADPSDEDADEVKPIDEIAGQIPPAMDEEDMDPEQMRQLEEAFEVSDLDDSADPMAVLRGETRESEQFLGFQDTGIPSTIMATPPASRKARVRRHEANQGKAHAAQFKAAMIPLLLAVGVILMIIGVVCLVAGRPGDGSRITISGELFGVAYVTWIAILSFPIGSILLFGAWLFHRELRDAEDNTR